MVNQSISQAKKPAMYRWTSWTAPKYRSINQSIDQAIRRTINLQPINQSINRSKKSKSDQWINPIQSIIHSKPLQINKSKQSTPFQQHIHVKGNKKPSRYELTNRIGFLQPHAVFGILCEHSLSHVVVLRVVKSTRVRMMMIAVMGHEVLLADVLLPIDHGGFAVWVAAAAAVAATAAADAAARCRGHVIPSSAKDHSSHRIELVRCVLGKWEDWRRMNERTAVGYRLLSRGGARRDEHREREREMQVGGLDWSRLVTRTGFLLLWSIKKRAMKHGNCEKAVIMSTNPRPKKPCYVVPSTIQQTHTD